MSGYVNKEALGDWSGIKGTEYHLLYAIWLLLCKGASHVAFYAGNDLLTPAISPPLPEEFQDVDEEPPTISVYSESSEGDIWIQLKSTDLPWTLARLLPKQHPGSQQDNLLKNFICNAFLSEQKSRTWRVQLVTQGTIKSSEIQSFLTNPKDPFLTRLIQEIQKASVAIEETQGGITPKDEGLRNIAFEVLRQLSETKPKSFDSLKSQIEAEIAFSCFNRDLTYQIANSLRGALLEDASIGPASARTYDVSWLNEKAGWPVRSAALFDQNPAAACEEAVKQVLPVDWSDAHFVRRQHFETALQLFLNAPETLFALVGSSGRGKSWVTADLALRILKDRIRLLVPGHSLLANADLPSIIAKSIRRFTSTADWTDEQLFRRILAAAKVHNDGPLIIVIDDLVPPTSGADVFIKNVAALASDCGKNGIKVVVTCQQQVWDLYKLAEAIPDHQLFVIERGFSEKGSEVRRPTYSLLLGDLTPDELTEAVKRRLPETTHERVPFLLRAASFSVLRNPYLLARYLDQHAAWLSAPPSKPGPVDVNALLDNRVGEALKKIAPSLSLTDDDLNPAFDLLVSILWPKRVEGLPYGRATDALKTMLGNQTSSFLAEIRKTGLITATGNVNLAEGPLADRLYAKYWGGLPSDDSAQDAMLAELRPEVDSGVVVALLRGVVSDPITFGTQLLAKDKQWIRAVSEGVAQLPTADHRAVAILAALLRSDPKHWILSEVGDALGQLASRDDHAWKACVRMYLSDDATERQSGEYILGAAMEFAPQRVASAVRLRLSRASKIPSFFQRDKKRRARIIKGALEPFQEINHGRAAEFANRLIERYAAISKYLDDQDKYALFEDIDRARGRIALHGETDELDQLFRELKSEDQLERYRAACALRAVAFEQPHAVKEPVCEALLRPNEFGSTLNRLLLACYPLILADPAILLRTLKASALTDWDTPTHTAGQVLGLLGDLAAKQPHEVYPLLPARLTAFHPEWRAFLSEMHAYAWWRCAEKLPEAVNHVTSLTAPDLTKVPKEFVPFAYRGAAIAQLGHMCVGEVSADSLAGNHFFYPLWDLEYAYVNTRDFIQRHSKFLLERPEYEQLEALLVSCVIEEDRVRVHPIEKQLCQSQFRVATLCVEMLSQFGEAATDPLETLTLLPRDWQALQMSRELLERGHDEPAFISFVEKLCEERGHGAKSFQAAHERDQCLALLAARETSPHAALRRYNRDAGRSLFATTARAHGLARMVDSYPSELLSLLDLSIQDASDLSTLYFWHNESTSWRGWLLSWVYKRMFDMRAIRIREAKELCQHVLAAVETLPDSAKKQEYLTVYRTIGDWLNGKTIPPGLAGQDGNPIQQAHAATMRVFRNAAEAFRNPDITWLKLSLSDSRGWVESQYEFNDGELSLVSQSYRNYIFPSLRLAYVAIGSRHNLIDPAAKTLVERKQVKELIDRFPDIFRESATCDSIDDHKRRRLGTAVTAIEEQLLRTPYDEYLVASQGHVLLQLGRFVDADRSLRECLQLPGCTGNTRASVFYNLACVQSRLGNELECRDFLEQSAALRPLDVKHTSEDADLASVRDQNWFRELIRARTIS